MKIEVIEEEDEEEGVMCFKEMKDLSLFNNQIHTLHLTNQNYYTYIKGITPTSYEEFAIIKSIILLSIKV